MGAAAVMSPATAAMGIVIEADAITYQTTEEIEEVNGEKNLTSEDTLVTNPAGETIHNNAGTITTNNGTVENNSGRVEVNYGEVTGGRVGENHGTVTASEGGSFSVEYNCDDGTVNGAGGNDTSVGTNDGTVSNVKLININNGIANNVDTIEENNYQPPAPQPSGDSGDGDDPAPAPSPQPVDNPGGDSSSMGSLTVLPSETPTIQQEEKTFVNTLNSEMAKLGDMSASAASGPAGQQTINVNMGANNSYTSGMIDALETATDQNVAVAMTVRENGKPMTFTVPANSDYSAVDSYYAQTGSTSEGYRMIQSLVSGSAIEDASGNKIVNTTDTNTLMIRSDAQAVLYWIDHGDTLTTGRGDFYFEGNMLQNNGNQPATDDTANAQLAANVVDGGMIAAQPVKAPAVAITSGGTAKDTTVNNGDTAAIAAVTNGGTATTATVTNGGTAIPAIVNGSTQTIHNPGIYGGTHTVHTGEAVVASGTLPATASSPGTFAVTDNRRVIITNGQGSFADGNGSINIIDLR